MADNSHFSLKRAELPKELAYADFRFSNFVLRLQAPTGHPVNTDSESEDSDFKYSYDKNLGYLLYKRVNLTSTAARSMPPILEMCIPTDDSLPYYDFYLEYFEPTGDCFVYKGSKLAISWFCLSSPQLLFLDVTGDEITLKALAIRVSKIIARHNSESKVDLLPKMRRRYPSSFWAEDREEKGVIGTWFFLSRPLDPSTQLPATCSIEKRDLFAHIYTPMYETDNATPSNSTPMPLP